MSYGRRPRRAVVNKEEEMIRKARLTRRLVTSTGLAATIVTLAAQPVLAFDGRSPDTRDALAGTAVTAVDGRSPDTRSLAVQATLGSIVSDARDAASRALPHTPTASPADTPITGFDWHDFAIGLGAGLGSILIMALLAAAGLASRERRRGGTRPAMS
jgi:hypothetical protein